MSKWSGFASGKHPNAKTVSGQSDFNSARARRRAVQKANGLLRKKAAAWEPKRDVFTDDLEDGK